MILIYFGCHLSVCVKIGYVILSTEKIPFFSKKTLLFIFLNIKSGVSVRFSIINPAPHKKRAVYKIHGSFTLKYEMLLLADANALVEGAGF